MRRHAHHLQVLTDRFSKRPRGKCVAVAWLTTAWRSLTQAFMPVRDQIAEKLAAALSPQSLDVEDESQNHAGHAGHRPGGETHFRVHIVSESFRGKSRVERHRMINQIL